MFVHSDEHITKKGKNVYLYTLHDRKLRQNEICLELSGKIVVSSYSSIGIIKLPNNTNIIIKPKSYLDVTFTYNYESLLIIMINGIKKQKTKQYVLDNITKFVLESCHSYLDNYALMPVEWIDILWEIALRCPTHLPYIELVHHTSNLNKLKNHYYALCKKHNFKQRWDKFTPADIFIYDEIDTILQTKNIQDFKAKLINKINDHTLYPISIKKTTNPKLQLVTPNNLVLVNSEHVFVADKNLSIQYRQRMNYHYMELSDTYARYGKGKIFTTDTLEQVKYSLCLHKDALQFFYLL